MFGDAPGADLGVRRARRLRPQLAGAVGARAVRDAEVDELYAAKLSDEEVGGLEVAVGDLHGGAVEVGYSG